MNSTKQLLPLNECEYLVVPFQDGKRETLTFTGQLEAVSEAILYSQQTGI